ncbi:hypothetical protein [Flavobacterium sp. BFFFF1]|uniref:hypothetical protein n=1 Tax=Flavobacterium sp. BFFFF1 TaxID=2015557 RepID=UPI0025BB3ABC|nr:hypothetical protein [Flavobacterium sp. BFFFF1]
MGKRQCVWKSILRSLVANKKSSAKGTLLFVEHTVPKLRENRSLVTNKKSSAKGTLLFV